MRGPLAIGGVGGSGTRVVAEIAEQCRIYMGDCLNAVYDNLWFTLLLKRPQWFASFPHEHEIEAALRLFRRAMEHGLKDAATSSDRLLLEACEREWFDRGQFEYPEQEQHICDARRTCLASHGCDTTKRVGWGWKEPNTHVFLSALADHFLELKYVHVIRHGCDMAFSGNLLQTRNWSRHFGLPQPSSERIPPAHALDYWIAANTRALDVGRRKLKRRFLLLRFEDLCREPQREVRRLLDFWEIPVSETELERLSAMVKMPGSVERFRNFNVDQFSTAQLKRVATLGYRV